MASFIGESFKRVCKETKQRESFYLSLYVRDPFYGGPEEGGWRGEDVVLEATQEFPTQEAVDNASCDAEKLAVELSRQARKQFGERCAEEMDWLEERGLDADFLPEPDGEKKYFMVVESTPGSHESQGCRHYE